MPTSPNVIELPLTVAHSEVRGSPTESISAEGKFMADRVLRCKWSKRFDLANELLEGYQVQLGNLSVRYQRQYPHRKNVYVKSIGFKNHAGDAQPDNGDTTQASYEWAHLTVHYEQGEFMPNGVPGQTSAIQIAEESYSPVGRFLVTADPTKLYLQGSNTEIQAGAYPGVYAPMHAWNYTLNQVRSVPNGWTTYAGYVNESSVRSSSLQQIFEAETLLFDGVDLQRSILSSGPLAWKAPLKFIHNPNGWNKYPDAAGNWKELHTAPGATVGAGTRKKQYKTVNFVSELNVIV